MAQRAMRQLGIRFLSYLNFGLYFLKLCAAAVPSEQAFSPEVYFFFTRVFYRQFTSMLVLHPPDLVSPDLNNLSLKPSILCVVEVTWWEFSVACQHRPMEIS